MPENSSTLDKIMLDVSPSEVEPTYVLNVEYNRGSETKSFTIDVSSRVFGLKDPMTLDRFLLSAVEPSGMHGNGPLEAKHLYWMIKGIINEEREDDANYSIDVYAAGDSLPLITVSGNYVGQTSGIQVHPGNITHDIDETNPETFFEDRTWTEDVPLLARIFKKPKSVDYKELTIKLKLE